MRPKVLLALNPWVYEACVTPESWERLEAVCEPVGRDRAEPYTESELVAALQGVTGLMSWGPLVPGLPLEVIEQVPDLKLVGLWDDRLSNTVDLEAGWAQGVQFVDVSNIASSQPVAEWVLALILVCLRNGGEVYRQMIAGTETWANAQNERFVHGELTGKRVGLIGCGHVGQRLIELLAPFPVDLLVHDPYLPEETVTRLGIRRDELDPVLDHAEILVVQVPHTPRTRGMIGPRELDRLRPGAILVSACRGPVIVSEALLAKLEAGELIAGLDVFDPEPLPKDSPFRNLPNAFISPHIAWYAPHAFPRYFDAMVDEFERFFRGEPLRYEITRSIATQRAGEEPLSK